jgi:hypothetical protein
MPWRRCSSRWHTRYPGSGCTAGVCEGAPTVCSRASNLITDAGRRFQDPAAAWTRDVQLTHRPPILVVESMAACQRQGPRRRRSRPGRRRTEDMLLRALQRSLAGLARQRCSGLHDAACEQISSWWHHRGAVAQPALRNTVRSAPRGLSCGDCARGPARLPGLLRAMVKTAMIRCSPVQSHGGLSSTAVTSHGSRTLAQPARGGRPGCGMGTGHDVFPSEAVM